MAFAQLSAELTVNFSLEADLPLVSGFAQFACKLDVLCFHREQHWICMWKNDFFNTFQSKSAILDGKHCS